MSSVDPKRSDKPKETRKDKGKGKGKGKHKGKPTHGLLRRRTIEPLSSVGAVRQVATLVFLQAAVITEVAVLV